MLKRTIELILKHEFEWTIEENGRILSGMPDCNYNRSSFGSHRSSFGSLEGSIEEGIVVITYPYDAICCLDGIAPYLDFAQQLEEMEIPYTERLKRGDIEVTIGKEDDYIAHAKEYLLAHAKRFTDLAERFKDIEVK